MTRLRTCWIAFLVAWMVSGSALGDPPVQAPETAAEMVRRFGIDHKAHRAVAVDAARDAAAVAQSADFAAWRLQHAKFVLALGRLTQSLSTASTDLVRKPTDFVDHVEETMQVVLATIDACAESSKAILLFSSTAAMVERLQGDRQKDALLRMSKLYLSFAK